MPPKVKRLPRAIADGLDVWLHIAEDNLTAADNLVQRLDEAMERLAEYPELGPERPNLGQGIRILPVESITIFYRVAAGHVEVVRILHSARDITPDLLSE
jgi:toxin ParE1/3/4